MVSEKGDLHCTSGSYLQSNTEGAQLLTHAFGLNAQPPLPHREQRSQLLAQSSLNSRGTLLWHWHTLLQIIRDAHWLQDGLSRHTSGLNAQPPPSQLADGAYRRPTPPVVITARLHLRGGGVPHPHGRPQILQGGRSGN